MLDLVSSGEYVLINAMEICEGGPFTRYDPSEPNNTSKKSLLDIIIVSKNLQQFIEKLEIDSNLDWTPYGQFKGNLKYTDHYALKLSFIKIPMRKLTPLPGKKYTIWNTKRMNGWEQYRN